MNHLFDLLIPQGEDSARIALTDAQGRKTSYGALDYASARMAQALADLGLTKGDRLLAQVAKAENTVVLYLATIRLGAIFVPLNTDYTAAETGYFIDNAAPRIFVTIPARRDEIRSLCAGRDISVATLTPEGAGTLDIAAASAAPHRVVDCGPDDIAAILYTSGTTGRSKGAMLGHGNLASNAGALAQAWGYGADDVLIHALPIFHTHGLFVALNLTFLTRACAILLPKFDAGQIIALLPRASVLMGVPTFYTRLLQHPELTRDNTAHMRLFISGSAPLLAVTHAEWQDRTGHAILERYGMTETNMNTSNPLEGIRKPGTVGRPLPGVEVRISGGDGVIGMVEVKGPNVFGGYWQRPELNATEFTQDGFFITGDLGRLDGDGYLTIEGRAKDLIIAGGYNIYPKELETLIDDQPHVIESAVFGVPDADLGERIIAAVVAEDAFDDASLRAVLARDLAPFKRPKDIVILQALPRNTMGKVQKNLLRQEYTAQRRKA